MTSGLDREDSWSTSGAMFERDGRRSVGFLKSKVLHVNFRHISSRIKIHGDTNTVMN